MKASLAAHLLLLACPAGLSVLAAQLTSMSLHDVLARQEQNMGALGSLETLTLDVRMDEPEETYDLTIRIQRPDRMRVDLRKFGLSVYSEGLGPEGPWQQHLLQWSPRPTSQSGGTAIVNGVEGAAWGRSLREMHNRGHAVSLLPRRDPREIGVRVVFRNGTQRDYFVDSAGFRIVRSVQTYALHPDLKGEARKVRTIESMYRDYRRIDGYWFPMRIENRDRSSGELVQTVTVRALRVNDPMESTLFDAR